MTRIITGHQARTASSQPATTTGATHRCHAPRRPAIPTDRAATRTTRATAVTSPSSLVVPATRISTTVAARADGSSRSWSPKATAPTAASDQSGSA